MNRTRNLENPMKYTHKAFTLIELLVVIGIIAVLAAISLPVFTAAQRHGQMARAMANARGIGLALRMYADDNGGNFPGGKNSLGETIETSNDAFRDLIPTYIDDESVFALARSKAGPKADNKVEPASRALEAGENHYAYVEGLDSTSRSAWPLIVDGTDGTGHYTTDESRPGGIWGGKKAIVITVANSAEAVPLRGSSDRRYLPRFDDPTQDGLDVSAYMGEQVRLLDPAIP